MKTILEQLGYKDLGGDYRGYINTWVELWQGNIKGFHEYKEFNGREYVTRHRKTLGMGKKVCEDWADTLYNPETKITIGETEQEKEARLQEQEAKVAEAKELKKQKQKELFEKNVKGKDTEKTDGTDPEQEETGFKEDLSEDKETNEQEVAENKEGVDKPKTVKTKQQINQEKLDDILENNNFVNRLNVLLEKTFAFGTGATVVNKNLKDEVKIDFVDVRNIYPLKTEYGEITECAFSSQLSHEMVALQVHKRENDKFIIENYVFKKQDQSFIPMELPDNLEQSFESNIQLYQIIKPALANNVDIDQPLGLSIFANAIDEIKGVDQAYSSLDSELTTGRIRAFIQTGGLDYGQRDDGSTYPVYDKNQQEYYILPEDIVNDEGTFIKVDTPALRIPQIEQALEKQLTLCGRKVGFGDDAYSFRDGSIYTNTAQIVSTNSKFFKTRQKHLSVLENALIKTVKAMLYLHDGTEIEEVAVDFDDSIIEDNEAVFNRNMMLLNGGHLSIQEFFERTENLTQDMAQELVDKINADLDLAEEVGLEGEDYFPEQDPEQEEDDADEKDVVEKLKKVLTDKDE